MTETRAEHLANFVRFHRLALYSPNLLALLPLGFKLQVKPPQGASRSHMPGLNSAPTAPMRKVSGGPSDNRAQVADDAIGWRLDRALSIAGRHVARAAEALISRGEVTGPSGAPIRDPAARPFRGASISSRSGAVPAQPSPRIFPWRSFMRTIICW